MSNLWVAALAEAVAKGETGAQFAIPDAKYVGDVFFITNQENKILVILMWNGVDWTTEHDVVNIELPTQKL